MRFEDGRLLTDDFRDYTMPVAEALPDLETVLVESIDPNGPLGPRRQRDRHRADRRSHCQRGRAGGRVRVQCLPITGEKLLAAMLRAQTATAAEVTDA